MSDLNHYSSDAQGKFSTMGAGTDTKFGPAIKCKQCGGSFRPFRFGNVYCSRECRKKMNNRDYRQRTTKTPPKPRRVRMFPDLLALRCMIAHPDMPEAVALRNRLLPVVIPQEKPRETNWVQRWQKPTIAKSAKFTPPVVVMSESPVWGLHIRNRGVNTIRVIQREVARRYEMSTEELISMRRNKVEVRARHIAMYLAKTMTPQSLPEIGRRFGGKDHTTVLHAVRNAEARIKADPEYAAEIAALKGVVEQYTA